MSGGLLLVFEPRLMQERFCGHIRRHGADTPMVSCRGLGTGHGARGRRKSTAELSHGLSLGPEQGQGIIV